MATLCDVDLAEDRFDDPSPNKNAHPSLQTSGRLPTPRFGKFRGLI